MSSAIYPDPPRLITGVCGHGEQQRRSAPAHFLAVSGLLPRAQSVATLLDVRLPSCTFATLVRRNDRARRRTSPLLSLSLAPPWPRPRAGTCPHRTAGRRKRWTRQGGPGGRTRRVDPPASPLGARAFLRRTCYQRSDQPPFPRTCSRSLQRARSNTLSLV